MSENGTPNVKQVRYSYREAPTIRNFAGSNAFIRGLMGPFGSGKSSGCVAEIVVRGIQQRAGPDGIKRTRWAVIRNTYTQLSDTTVKTFHQWFPPINFGEWRKSENKYIINAFEKTEIEILFRALDRPDHIDNLLSLELTGAWVNEAREVPWQIIEALQGRVGRFPAQRDGGPTWHGIIMDTNPPDVDSRWYKFFEEGELNQDFARIFKQPPGLIKKTNDSGETVGYEENPKAENRSNLVPNYYLNLSQGKDHEWVKVYVLGEYGFVVDGKAVYPEYKDLAHCSDKVIVSNKLPIYRGWDFGLTPACVFAQLSSRGQLVVFDELVSESMGIDSFSEDVISHCSNYYPDAEFIDIGDPAGKERAQTDEKTCFQILHSKGIMIEPGMQSLQIRLESVRKPLTTFRGVMGFVLHPRCKMLRKGFQGGYQFRRLQTSVEKYTLSPDKNMYSHPMNALEYVCTRLFGSALTSPKPYGGKDEDSNFEFQHSPRSEVTGY